MSANESVGRTVLSVVCVLPVCLCVWCACCPVQAGSDAQKQIWVLLFLGGKRKDAIESLFVKVGSAVGQREDAQSERVRERE